MSMSAAPTDLNHLGPRPVRNAHTPIIRSPKMPPGVRPQWLRSMETNLARKRSYDLFRSQQQHRVLPSLLPTDGGFNVDNVGGEDYLRTGVDPNDLGSLKSRLKKKARKYAGSITGGRIPGLPSIFGGGFSKWGAALQAKVAAAQKKAADVAKRHATKGVELTKLIAKPKEAYKEHVRSTKSVTKFIARKHRPGFRKTHRIWRAYVPKKYRDQIKRRGRPVMKFSKKYGKYVISAIGIGLSPFTAGLSSLIAELVNMAIAYAQMRRAAKKMRQEGEKAQAIRQEEEASMLSTDLDADTMRFFTDNRKDFEFVGITEAMWREMPMQARVEFLENIQKGLGTKGLEEGRPEGKPAPKPPPGRTIKPGPRPQLIDSSGRVIKPFPVQDMRYRPPTFKVPGQYKFDRSGKQIGGKRLSVMELLALNKKHPAQFPYRIVEANYPELRRRPTRPAPQPPGAPPPFIDETEPEPVADGRPPRFTPSRELYSQQLAPPADPPRPRRRRPRPRLDNAPPAVRKGSPEEAAYMPSASEAAPRLEAESYGSNFESTDPPQFLSSGPPPLLNEPERLHYADPELGARLRNERGTFHLGQSDDEVNAELDALIAEEEKRLAVKPPEDLTPLERLRMNLPYYKTITDSPYYKTIRDALKPLAKGTRAALRERLEAEAKAKAPTPPRQTRLPGMPVPQPTGRAGLMVGGAVVGGGILLAVLYSMFSKRPRPRKRRRR